MKKNIEILDEKEAEFRRLIPFASKIFGHQKQFTRDGLKKWKARRRIHTRRSTGERIINARGAASYRGTRTQWESTGGHAQSAAVITLVISPSIENEK